jgi:hypothetical protein
MLGGAAMLAVIVAVAAWFRLRRRVASSTSHQRKSF